MRGPELMQWFFPTRTFQRMHGGGDGETGIDDTIAERGFDNIGAWILGRNMFGPVRGPWPDGSWKGWWGDEPPYHVPVFVLTHHARAPLEMKGGTTFHFVTDGIESALAQAKAAAGGRDVLMRVDKPAGAPQAIGEVPMIGSRPPHGGMPGEALVNTRPIMPASIACST